MTEDRDSLHHPADTAEYTPTASEASMPKRQGWEGPTYYGRSQLKIAPFENWVVGGYIFLAGLSGGAAVVSTVAELARGERAAPIGRRGRYLSMLAPSLGSLLLIWDLHTPQRFYNMWRIFKTTSPMSIGTWILTSFIAGATPAAASQAAADVFGLGWARKAARLFSAPAAISGAGISTYTPALLSATSNPYWAAGPRALGVRFGASSIASGAAALALGQPAPIQRGLNAVGAAALLVEGAATAVHQKTVRDKGVGEALKSKWGHIEEIAVTGLGVAVPLALYALSLRSRNSRKAEALADLASLGVIGGSLLLRVATLGIGDEAARRPEISFRFSQPENLPKSD
jgi:protein NrfD